MPGNRHARLRCLEGSTSEEREGLFLFIALRWMQDREGVMMWLTENIQACLRIFRRTQHQWLARDILHQPQGVFAVFVLWPAFTELIHPIRLIRGKIEIQRTRASHHAKDIVVAPGEPFCTANGSYFVFWGLRRSCMAGLGVTA